MIASTFTGSGYRLELAKTNRRRSTPLQYAPFRRSERTTSNSNVEDVEVREAPEGKEPGSATRR